MNQITKSEELSEKCSRKALKLLVLGFFIPGIGIILWIIALIDLEEAHRLNPYNKQAKGLSITILAIITLIIIGLIAFSIAGAMK